MSPAEITLFVAKSLSISLNGKNLEEIKKAIQSKSSEKLNNIFSSTRKLRKEIIKAGQETDKPNFGRK